MCMVPSFGFCWLLVWSVALRHTQAVWIHALMVVITCRNGQKWQQFNTIKVDVCVLLGSFVNTPGEGIAVLYPVPNPFLLNETCLNQKWQQQEVTDARVDRAGVSVT